MNGTTRFLIIVLVNVMIVSLMLYRMIYSGIDVSDTRLIDNADNVSFMFDFITYLAVLFFANTIILAYPSSKSTALKRAIGMLNIRSISPRPIKRNRKNPA